MGKLNKFNLKIVLKNFQSVQTLDFDLKSCFVLLNTSSRSTRCFGLVCLGSRVALLVVVLPPSQSFILCVAQHLESLCSL